MQSQFWTMHRLWNIHFLALVEQIWNTVWSTQNFACEVRLTKCVSCLKLLTNDQASILEKIVWFDSANLCIIVFSWLVKYASNYHQSRWFDKGWQRVWRIWHCLNWWVSIHKNSFLKRPLRGARNPAFTQVYRTNHAQKLLEIDAHAKFTQSRWILDCYIT